MSRKCTTCQHIELERINAELALSPNVAEVAARYGIARRSMSRHRQNCMTQKQIAQIRGLTPAQAEVDIAELARRGGEAAVIGFSRLIQECQEAATTCDKMAMHGEAVKYRKLQLDAYREQAKIAAIYPGRKTVTNNNLVLGDMAQFMDFVDAVLMPYPDARSALSVAWLAQSRPVLEHAA